MPMTTPPWAPEDMDARDLMSVPRRWPLTTAYVAVTAIVFALLCWAGAAR